MLTYIYNHNSSNSVLDFIYNTLVLKANIAYDKKLQPVYDRILKLEKENRNSAMEILNWLKPLIDDAVTKKVQFYNETLNLEKMNLNNKISGRRVFNNWFLKFLHIENTTTSQYNADFISIYPTINNSLFDRSIYTSKSFLNMLVKFEYYELYSTYTHNKSNTILELIDKSIITEVYTKLQILDEILVRHTNAIIESENIIKSFTDYASTMELNFRKITMKKLEKLNLVK